MQPLGEESQPRFNSRPSSIDMTIIRYNVVWQSVNKTQATLQMTDQAATKKWLVKMNLNW